MKISALRNELGDKAKSTMKNAVSISQIMRDNNNQNWEASRLSNASGIPPNKIEETINVAKKMGLFR